MSIIVNTYLVLLTLALIASVIGLGFALLSIKEAKVGALITIPTILALALAPMWLF